MTKELSAIDLDDLMECDNYVFHTQEVKEALLMLRKCQDEIKQLKAIEPDLFWNDSDPEESHSSINDVVVAVYENSGCLLAGDVITVQRAFRISDAQVKITSISDDGHIEWEELK
ncbi:MAG: hypothetical protein V4536_08555 [Pseudomonadota bacterium]